MTVGESACGPLEAPLLKLIRTEKLPTYEEDLSLLSAHGEVATL